MCVYKRACKMNHCHLLWLFLVAFVVINTVNAQDTSLALTHAVAAAPPPPCDDAILQTIATALRQAWPVLMSNYGWPPIGQPIVARSPPRGIMVQRCAFKGFYLPGAPLNGPIPNEICLANQTIDTLKWVNNGLTGAVPTCLIYNTSNLQTFWVENNPDLRVDFAYANSSYAFAAHLVNFVLSNVIFTDETIPFAPQSPGSINLTLANVTWPNTIMTLKLTQLQGLQYLQSYNFSGLSYMENFNISYNPNFQPLDLTLEFPLNTNATYFTCEYDHNAPFSSFIECELVRLVTPRKCLTHNISCFGDGGNSTTTDPNCFMVSLTDEFTNGTIPAQFCNSNETTTPNLTLSCYETSVVNTEYELTNVTVCNLTETVLNATECITFCDHVVGVCGDPVCQRDLTNATQAGYAIVPFRCDLYNPYDTGFVQRQLVECNFTLGEAWNFSAVENYTPNASLCFDIYFYNSLNNDRLHMTLCPPNPKNDGPFKGFLPGINTIGTFMTTFGGVNMGIAGCAGMRITSVTQSPNKKKCGNGCSSTCSIVFAVLSTVLLIAISIAIAVATFGAGTPASVSIDSAAIGADATAAGVTAATEVIAQAAGDAGAIGTEESVAAIVDGAVQSSDSAGEVIGDVADEVPAWMDRYVESPTNGQALQANKIPWVADEEEAQLDQALQVAEANKAENAATGTFYQVAKQLMADGSKIFSFTNPNELNVAQQIGDSLGATDVTPVLGQPGAYTFTMADGLLEDIVGDVSLDGSFLPIVGGDIVVPPVTASLAETLANVVSSYGVYGYTVPSMTAIIAAITAAQSGNQTAALLG